MSNRDNRKVSSIPSPYNFVPLSDTVLEPDWVEYVSQDLPFEDGLSGELSLEMEAMSPLYVRNGGAWTEEDRANEESPMHDFFVNLTGSSEERHYMIPGSSIKGALRNVLEIATFSKMSRIADSKYSMRMGRSKVRCKLSIGDAARNTSRKHFPNNNEGYVIDFADALFGYVRGKNALKGRVQVGHFKMLAAQNQDGNENEPQSTWETVLGSPKPTYYPNYVVQNGRECRLAESDRYVTYMDKFAKLRGWKRYPVRSVDDQPEQLDTRQKDSNEPGNITVYFRPLKKGSVFKGKIRFHNLRPVELGALLWVITLGGEKSRHHQVGLAKPLGFGRVRYLINYNDSIIIHPHKIHNKDSKYINCFISYMEKSLDNKWEKSEQVQSLLMMSDSNFQNANIKLIYPSLNEYIKYKKDKRVLAKYLESQKGKESHVFGSHGSHKGNTVSSASESIPQIPDKVIENLLSSARQISSKNLRKKLNSLEGITRENYEKLISNLQKRTDWNRRTYLQDQYNWYEALNNLSKRIE